MIEISSVLSKAKEITENNTFQAMEALIHNLNTMHSRAGAQVPFSSINYGTDTTEEGRSVIRNMLLATESGLGDGETPIFPVQIFKLKEGTSYYKEDPNYDLFKLAIRVSAKRLFPNFSFIDSSFNKPYYKGTPETEVSYMGCRTRVIGNVYDREREIVKGRGNLSFTSINLPRLGILANQSSNDPVLRVEKFFELLDNKIDLTFLQLEERLKVQSNRRVKNYPFLMGQGVWLDSEKLEYDDSIEEVLKHGTLTLGFIGLAETLIALIGKHHGESEEAQKLGLRIVAHMRKRCDDKSAERKMNYTLIATPAEGLSGRFVKMDKERFGEIENITDKNYYTNSFHVPVYYNIRILDKLRIEGLYHRLTNAGHITYIELDSDPMKNLESFETIVRAAHDNDCGYFAINHPVDSCPICNYSGVIGDKCPRCGRKEYEGLELDKLIELSKKYKNIKVPRC